MGRNPTVAPTISGRNGKEIERRFLLLDPPDRGLLGTPRYLNQLFINLRKPKQKLFQIEKVGSDRYYLHATQSGYSWCAAIPSWAASRLRNTALQLRLRKETLDESIVQSITIKGRGGKLCRKEWECDSATWLFDASRSVAKALDKIRYHRQEDKLIQVDFFDESVGGGVIAEIEFDTVDEATAHPGPQTLGPWIDVTHNDAFSQRSRMKTAKIPTIFGPVGTVFSRDFDTAT